MLQTPVFHARQLTSEQDIIQHEQMLFQAFGAKESPSWITRHYPSSGPNRIKAPIDYKSQIIGGVFDSSQTLQSTMAVNTRPDIQCQLHMIGFDKDALPQGAWVEVLNFVALNAASRQHLHALWRDALYLIQNHVLHVDYLYASCARPLLRYYTRLGCEHVSQHDITQTSGTFCLLRYRLADFASKIT